MYRVMWVLVSLCVISVGFGCWVMWMVMLKFFLIMFIRWLDNDRFNCICGYCVW